MRSLFFVPKILQKSLGDFNIEHGERFHLDIEPMERIYKRRRDNAVMGNYI